VKSIFDSIHNIRVVGSKGNPATRATRSTHVATLHAVAGARERVAESAFDRGPASSVPAVNQMMPNPQENPRLVFGHYQDSS
jgi:hypothetical protein